MAPTTSSSSSQNAAQQARAANKAAESAILSQAIVMTQLIYAQNIATPGQSNNVITVAPRNVGLIKGFWIELSGTMTESAGHDIIPTVLGPANFLSNITYYDLNNNLRINTPGWHMHFVDTVKRRRPFGQCFTLTPASASAGVNPGPTGFGNNMGANDWIQSPGTLISTGTASGTIRMLYWVPLAYSDRDLRGAVYANVVNATQQLVLTINPNPFVANSSDNTLAMYTTSAAGVGTLTNVTVNVYQEYFDQLPQGSNGPILPAMDLSTIYELKQTALTGMTTGQDFPLPYSNFRDFISTMFIMDNYSDGVLNAGTDINYIALQAANFTNWYKVDPFLLSSQTRGEIQMDFPVGMYYLSHRKKPISTVQYGNIELIVNPKGTLQSGAQILIAYEDFALVNAVTGAGSLPAG